MTLLGHQCQFPGCEYVLVIDGNMKNRRDVCLAKHAGKIQYNGLPGYVMTGCIQSPAFKSRYCKDHTERICVKGKGGDCVGMLYSYHVMLTLKCILCRGQRFRVCRGDAARQENNPTGNILQGM